MASPVNLTMPTVLYKLRLKGPSLIFKLPAAALSHPLARVTVVSMCQLKLDLQKSTRQDAAAIILLFTSRKMTLSGPRISATRGVLNPKCPSCQE